METQVLMVLSEVHNRITWISGFIGTSVGNPGPKQDSGKVKPEQREWVRIDPWLIAAGCRRMSWMSLGAKCVVLRCQGTERNHLCPHNRISGASTHSMKRGGTEIKVRGHGLE